MSFNESQQRLVIQLAWYMERGLVAQAIAAVDKLSPEDRTVYQSIIPLYQKELMAKFKISSLPMYDPVISYMLLMEISMRNYQLRSGNGSLNSLGGGSKLFKSVLLDVLSDADKEYAQSEIYRKMDGRIRLKYGICVVFTVAQRAVIAAAGKVLDKHNIPPMSTFGDISDLLSKPDNATPNANQLLSTLLDSIVRSSDDYNNLQNFFKEHLTTFSQRHSYVGTRFYLGDGAAVSANTAHGISERSFFVAIPVELEMFGVDSINWLPWLSNISKIIIRNQMRGVNATLCCYQGKQNEIVLPQDVWLQMVDRPLAYQGDPVKSIVNDTEQYLESIHCDIVTNGLKITRTHPVFHYDGAVVLTLDAMCLQVATKADAPIYPIEVDTTNGRQVAGVALFTDGLISNDKVTIMVAYDSELYSGDDIIRHTINSMCRPGKVQLVEYFSEEYEDDYPSTNRLLLNVEKKQLEWVPRGSMPAGYSEYQSVRNISTGKVEYVPTGAIPQGYQKVN